MFIGAESHSRAHCDETSKKRLMKTVGRSLSSETYFFSPDNSRRNTYFSFLHVIYSLKVQTHFGANADLYNIYLEFKLDISVETQPDARGNSREKVEWAPRDR